MVEEAEPFNFQKEAEEIQADMVNSMAVVNDPDSSNRATVQMETLEGTSYEMEWTIQNGL